MEFFATIGLITIAWIIYDFTKYVFIDSEIELEEEKKREQEDQETLAGYLEEGDITEMTTEEITQRVQKGVRSNTDDDFRLFVSNLNDISAMNLPVFKPLPKIKGYPGINEANLRLKRIGSYARLYYNLIDIFKPAINDNTMKVAVYSTEIIRRDVYAKVFENDQTKLSKEEVSKIFDSAATALQRICNNTQNLYAGLRKDCLESLSNSEMRYIRLNKIYSILNAEAIHFRAEPHWREYYKRLTESYIHRITSEPIKDTNPS